MRRASQSWVAAVAVALAGVAGGISLLGSPKASHGLTTQEIVAVEQLKTEAFKALRGGRFDQSNKLLTQAASISHDPSIERMASWTSGFESQRQEFVAERRKQYDKLAGQVQMLLGKEKPDYAMDVAARAFGLADDKQAFRAEPWVDSLVTGAVKRAEQDDQTEQWIRSLRLYSDLSVIEPAIPLWKDRLKLATRRVRLLALYTPDVLKGLQESESKERDEIDALMKAWERDHGDATQTPTTQPTTKKADTADSDAFRIDWRDTLRGVRLDMLWESLVNARSNYYREVSFKDMALGGLKGIDALATTKGLEKAFPKLADAKAHAAFQAALREYVNANKLATSGTEQRELRKTLAGLATKNRETVDLPEEVLVSEFADGAFAELDQFTSMIWPSDLEEFNKTTQGKFSGVGIQIQTDEDGSLKVVSPLEDSPAYKAGIKAGDVVTHINGKSAKGITINQAVKTITGAPDSMVVLTVRSPDQKVKEYSIRRETIHVASIKGWTHKPGGGWEYYVDPQQRIAYLRLTNFTGDTSKELDHAIEYLRESNARGIILDLRYNPGGLLSAATDVVDKFLREGVIVSTRPDRETGNQPTVAVAKPDDGDCDLPLVVLVNQYSASASEIVSGALKDQHRALIVGERTFGKGSVQMLFPLADRTAFLKLTTSHYYLPSGRCIHREENSKEWGVDPDVTVEMTPDQMRAAIDARQELDILRDINAKPAEGEQSKLKDKAEAAKDVKDSVAVKAKEKKGLLPSDPQLSAALLLLRLELSGAQL